MGKEAKIGLAVIGVLVLTLGAVITWRVMSSGSNSKPEGSEQASADADSANTGASSDRDTSGKKGDTTPKKKDEADKPTVLSVQAGSLDEQPPAPPSANDEDLAGAAGMSTTGDESAGQASAGDAAQSYMPAPTGDSSWASSYGRYGSRASMPAWRSGGSDASTADRDSSAGYGVSGQSGNSLRYPTSNGASRMPPAPVPNSQRAEGDTSMATPGYDQSSSRYATPRQWSTSGQGDSPTASEQRPTGNAPSGIAALSDAGAAGRPMGAGSSGRQADGTYTVQPNDNFWRISEKLYGTGAYFKALAECNADRVERPNRLQVGEVIDAPDVAELEQKFPELCPTPEHRYVPQDTQASMVSHHQGGRSYTVGEGDTLYRIARYELGDATRWDEIYALNREVIGEDFNHLRPGTQIVLPPEREAAGFDTPGAGEPSDTVTQRPEGFYSR